MRIALARGGICGSDLHDYNHGGFGAVRLREPMILGHEVSGHIREIGPGVRGFAPGDLVAVSPSRPCGACPECLRGLPNHCLNMRFYGSAMPFPHIQGAFCEEIVASAGQCVRAEGLGPEQAAMAGPMLGAEVLVTGCGPIGLLTIMAARRADPEALAPHAAGKGRLDVLFECSGAEAALCAGIATLRPRGVVVQLGLSGDMRLPMMQITVREIELRGAFRFHEEFAVAIDLMRAGLIAADNLVTHAFPLQDFAEAFATTNDRTRAMKVQLTFGAA
ncbi:L-idonate 5-dehydrogenase [Phaeovulum vinaykumarii]|uniref:L-idonate 5-dehydrogenase n=1 Tax=Phaeovulum vinaykumarii TaxID=407234 RepID=A0A1N7M8H5_9RHOB|nr:L-idonate 5-dehydrogenase [Phaeovulum vinaykumarii]SIS82281.1 L-idonate 5-dehydrogenase [Phaeovulum vinaykumarii]SOC11083.1 L-idonate 5-dehydrogenase [Phaeovulum vinaykumarii]